MTTSVGIVVVLAAGMAIAVLGTLAASRPSAAGGWLARRLGRTWSEPNVALAGALVAVFGIFVAIVAVIAEIWWLQGVRVP